MTSPSRARSSRRGFLSGAAAAAFAPLVAAPLVADATRVRAPKVAIVGAGIAGLTAARMLHDRGVSATVFEAQQRVGGRMHSERAFWGNGQVSEYGGELIDSDHTTMHALVKRFGLQFDDVLADEGTREQTISLGGEYYPERRLFEEFRPVYRVLREQVAAAGYVTTYNRSTSAGRALDALSLAAWIRRFVPGGAQSNVGKFIDLQYTAEYGIDPELQSSLNMVYWLGRQPAYDARTGEFVALGPSDERYHIAGGNQQLPERIATSLPPGSVQLGSMLEAIATRADGRVELSFSGAHGPRVRTFDAVILTVPFSVLRELDTTRAQFDARKRLAIETLRYGDHSKLIVQFERRYWREPGAWPGSSSGDITYDGPFVQTWEATRGQPGQTGLIVDFAETAQSRRLTSVGAYTTSVTPQTAAHAKTFVAQLERVWPGARAASSGRATLSHLAADPYARGSYSGWSRGQYAAFAGYERVRQGNILFAGEHCSVIFQGFMEGAAREAVRAARDVLREAGIALSA